ncbi:MAG: RdgB/HAM1 family non-canonical purine NTP pyrophosphatase [Pyrinomonadaceae bacterium MAG19_C2-C3]|nr:RdgB/HAM1 family non-canonical purine NTP pyrophosphatase [Pyrinomonadaceae bacterium MAG19_C2-C3]
MLNAPNPFSELLIATHNQGKLKEWQNLLAGLPLTLRTLRDYPACPEVVESGATFAANARIKAEFYRDFTRLPTLADDSGLEVRALDNAPGVFSARYGDAAFTDAERSRYLLAQIRDVPMHARTARFVCVITLASPLSNHVETFSGVCEGSIAMVPRGTKGFGYDPIFIPDGHTQTFAELDAEIKNRISHRARAAREVCAYFQSNTLR